MATPEPLVNALHPSVVDRIDPQFAEIYNKYQAPFLRADQVTYEEFNAERSKYSFPITQGPLPEVGEIKIFKIPVDEPQGEIDVQVFMPTQTSYVRNGLEKNGKLPAHVNFHGGGFVIGGLKSDESWCRQACEILGCVIVNVDYRLSPEFPHPTPLMDSWKALNWVFKSGTLLGIDVSRVSVGGMSAGGNLAAVLALMARNDPSLPKLVMQLLVVPIVDVRFIPIEGSCNPETTPYDTYIRNEFAPCLPLNRLIWFYNLWLGTDVGKLSSPLKFAMGTRSEANNLDEKRKKMAEHFWASPILASSHENLAPASIHVAGVDTLTSEGIDYYRVLDKAGVPSNLMVYAGCGHTFGVWDGELEKGKEFVQNSCYELRRAFRGEL